MSVTLLGEGVGSRESDHAGSLTYLGECAGLWESDHADSHSQAQTGHEFSDVGIVLPALLWASGEFSCGLL